MSYTLNRTQRLIYAVITVLALVILVDFTFFGSVKNQQIEQVQKSRQQTYNAARSYHFSYKVITSEYKFQVKEDFAKSELEGKMIEFEVSPLFNEVNWYRLDSADSKSFHSLRLASGIILPLLVILGIFLVYRFQLKIRNVLYILQILLLGDFIWLLT